MNTPSHPQGLIDVSNYLNAHARSEFQNLPEGGVHAVLSRLDPALQLEVVTMLKRAMDQSREQRDLPFQAKPNGDAFDRDLMALLDRLLTEDGAHALNRRMGTPTAAEQLAQLDGQPPSLRDALSSAFGISEE